MDRNIGTKSLEEDRRKKKWEEADAFGCVLCPCQPLPPLVHHCFCLVCVVISMMPVFVRSRSGKDEKS